MSTPGRVRKLLAMCIVGLMLAGAWCFSVLTTAREQARLAIDNRRACQALATQIELLRRRPVVAELKDIEVTDLTRRIDSAKAAAGMTDASVVRIEPQEPQRVGDSAYKEKVTRVLLRQVTQRQYITFLLTLRQNYSGLQVKEIRLSSPHDGSPNSTWTVDITLGYLIYSPATKAG